MSIAKLLNSFKRKDKLPKKVAESAKSDNLHLEGRRKLLGSMSGLGLLGFIGGPVGLFGLAKNAQAQAPDKKEIFDPFSPNLSIDNLKKLSVFKRLVLMSDIPDDYFYKSEGDLISYLLNYEITISASRFQDGGLFIDLLSFSDIIPDKIGYINTDGKLGGFRLDGQMGLDTGGNFYTRFRPKGWSDFNASSDKEGYINDNKHFRPKGWSNFNSSQKVEHIENKDYLRLEKDYRLIFREGTKLKCLELESDMKYEYDMIINEEEMSSQSVKPLHDHTDGYFLGTDKNSSSGENFCHNTTRPGDILTLNIGIKLFITHLIRTFPRLQLSSGRRSYDNNWNIGGAGTSAHIKGVAFDLVTTGLTADKMSEYLENVEAFMIAHRLNEKIEFYCHGAKYHIHVNIKKSMLPSSFTVSDHSKDFDLKVDGKKLYYTPIKGIEGKQDRFRLSRSDFKTLERDGFSIDSYLLFFDYEHQAEAREALAGLNLEKVAKEAVG